MKIVGTFAILLAVGKQSLPLMSVKMKFCFCWIFLHDSLCKIFDLKADKTMHRNSLQKWAFRQWNLKKKFLPNNAKMAQKGPENQYKNYS